MEWSAPFFSKIETPFACTCKSNGQQWTMAKARFLRSTWITSVWLIISDNQTQFNPAYLFLCTRESSSAPDTTVTRDDFQAILKSLPSLLHIVLFQYSFLPVTWSFLKPLFKRPLDNAFVKGANKSQFSGLGDLGYVSLFTTSPKSCVLQHCPELTTSAFFGFLL